MIYHLSSLGSKFFYVSQEKKTKLLQYLQNVPGVTMKSGLQK